MNLQHLKYFVTLSKNLHYGKSALQLNTTSPNLSYAISSLEKELGVKLFRKRGREIIHTPSGLIFLEYVEKAIENIELGKRAIDKISEERRTTIKLSVFRIQTIYKLLFEFTNANKKEQFKLAVHQCNSKKTIQYLKNMEMDVGFCSYQIEDPQLTFLPVIIQKLVCFVHPDHPLSHFPNLDLGMVAKFPLIIPRESDGAYEIITELFSKAGFTPFQPFLVDFTSAAAFLASKNLGVGVAFNLPALNVPEIKIIPLICPEPVDFFIYLTYLRDFPLPDAVQKFINYAKKGQLFSSYS